MKRFLLGLLTPLLLAGQVWTNTATRQLNITPTLQGVPGLTIQLKTPGTYLITAYLDIQAGLNDGLVQAQVFCNIHPVLLPSTFQTFTTPWQRQTIPVSVVFTSDGTGYCSAVVWSSQVGGEGVVNYSTYMLSTLLSTTPNAHTHPIPTDSN